MSRPFPIGARCRSAVFVGMRCTTAVFCRSAAAIDVVVSGTATVTARGAAAVRIGVFRAFAGNMLGTPTPGIGMAGFAKTVASTAAETVGTPESHSRRCPQGDSQQKAHSSNDPVHVVCLFHCDLPAAVVLPLAPLTALVLPLAFAVAVSFSISGLTPTGGAATGLAKAIFGAACATSEAKAPAAI